MYVPEYSRPLLIGHLARANPQARDFESSSEMRVIFHGPHAYISPRWYRDPLTRRERRVPSDFKERLSKAMAGFEIEMSNIEAKFKLSQNRNPPIP